MRQPGCDERLVRMWDCYLAYSKGAFRELYIPRAQLVPGKVTSDNRLMNEPERESAWQEFL